MIFRKVQNALKTLPCIWLAVSFHSLKTKCNSISELDDFLWKTERVHLYQGKIEKRVSNMSLERKKDAKSECEAFIVIYLSDFTPNVIDCHQ